MADVPRPGRLQQLWHWLADSPRGVIGLVADLIGIGTAVFVAVSLIVSEGVAAAIMASCLGGLAIVSLLTVWRLEVALRRRDQLRRTQERVGLATPALAAAIGDLSRGHLALSAARAGADQAFVQHCEAACKAFASAMQSLTGAACRVTLQEVYVPENGPDDEASVKTIASSYGPRPPSQRAVDLVRDNTDFSTLFEGAPVYLCNDLVEEIASGYRNSHWTPERLAEWRRSGEYPYRSTVVWPLRELVQREGEESSWDFAGFLSVDSDEVGTFDLDTVQPLGEALAHSAYSGLAASRSMQQEGK